MNDLRSNPDSDRGLFPIPATSHLEPGFNVLGCRHGYGDHRLAYQMKCLEKAGTGAGKGQFCPTLVTSFEQRIIQPVNSAVIGIVGQQVPVTLHRGRGNPDVVDGDRGPGLP